MTTYIVRILKPSTWPWQANRLMEEHKVIADQVSDTGDGLVFLREKVRVATFKTYDHWHIDGIDQPYKPVYAGQEKDKQ